MHACGCGCGCHYGCERAPVCVLCVCMYVRACVHVRACCLPVCVVLPGGARMLSELLACVCCAPRRRRGSQSCSGALHLGAPLQAGVGSDGDGSSGLFSQDSVPSDILSTLTLMRRDDKVGPVSADSKPCSSC